MKRNYVYAFNFALVWAILLIGFVSVYSQKSVDDFGGFSQELRPFDFSNKYYGENGVEPSLIVNRRDGMDEHSVIDVISDPRFRNVRIRSVFPAYDRNGKILYWNLYGELFKDAFLDDIDGQAANRMAEFYPLYIFPSVNEKIEFRQAHLIDLRDGYFEKNLLGLSVQVLIEFTDRIYTADGQQEMALLAKRNGFSGDGTPIIKTVAEIEELTRKNLITQKIKGLDDPAEAPYAIAKVIENPQRGAIAPDAFLLNNIGIRADQTFIEQFECLQAEGRWCER